MKIFILDKDSEDREKLKSIILNENLGYLAGESGDSLESIEDITDIKPDLILMDLLDDKLNGLKIIEETRKRNIKANFIIISDNDSKKVVEEAYKNGIDYYIYKPINEIEVKYIVKRTLDRINFYEKLGNMKQLFNDLSIFNQTIEIKVDCQTDINNILLKLGIIGENGAEEISKVTKYIVENKVNMNNKTIREISSRFTDNPKSMEQKMRRAISIALSNIASLGIEDYMNETFVEYGNSLFNFEQVKREMDYIRGKSYEKGSINMKKFIIGLATLCENKNN